MSKDDDLIVSCRCGCTSIVKRNGYYTQELGDVMELGLTASTLCRKRRFIKTLLMRSVFIAITILAAGVVGVAVTSSVSERNRIHSEEAETWCRVGEKAIKDNDDAKAVEAFTKALALKPEYRTYMFRSFAYWRMCKYDETIADLECAIHLDPSNPIAHHSLVDAKETARRKR